MKKWKELKKWKKKKDDLCNLWEKEFEIEIETILKIIILNCYIFCFHWNNFKNYNIL